MKILCRLASATFLLAVTLSCAAEMPLPDPGTEAQEAFAFVGVNVIPMDSDRVTEDQTVVVIDGRIETIGDRSTTTVPSGALQIDASGHYLIPSLSDMHIHLEGDAWNLLFPPEEQFSAEDLNFEELLFPYVANGVGTVQIMSALPEHVELRENIGSGEVLGPRLVLARMIDGPEKAWPPPISTWVGSPEEARQAVLDAHQTGYDRIKAYSFLDRASYEAILTTAKEVGMKVGGHIPSDLSLAEVLTSGQDLIAHSEEIAKLARGNSSQDQIEAFAAEIAASGVWITPTLTTSRNVLAVFDDFDRELTRPEVQYLHPMARGIWAVINTRLYQPVQPEHRATVRNDFFQFQRPLTEALGAAGARLMTGTDSLVPSIVPGFSIHDELAELVDAGLSPYQALYSSTTEPMSFLGELDQAGTIEVGKRANLVLLEGNPLTDISASRSISGVMLQGRWLPGEELKMGLKELEEGYRP